MVSGVGIFSFSDPGLRSNQAPHHYTGIHMGGNMAPMGCHFPGVRGFPCMRVIPLIPAYPCFSLDSVFHAVGAGVSWTPTNLSVFFYWMLIELLEQ